MVELEPTNLHWLYAEDPFRDLCAHGDVYLKINDYVVSDGEQPDWSVSTASYYLLDTISKDYNRKSNRHLIPCCGYTMWRSEDESDGIYIGECDNGIDWQINHLSGKVVHSFSDGKTEEVSDLEWHDAVISFSQEVFNFFLSASPKVVDDEFDRAGFESFLRKWQHRLESARIN